MNALTPRQTEVTRLASQGLGCKEIAASVGITVNTARITIQQARERVGAKTVAHLVAISIKEGFINVLCIALIVVMFAEHNDALRRAGTKRPTRRTDEVAIVI